MSATEYKRKQVNKVLYLEHRLIAEQMLGRPLEKNEVVHHINGNKLDNRPENLQVMDRHEHTAMHNTAKPSPHRKFSDDDVRYIRTCLKQGESVSELAKRMNVSVNTVARIKKRETYADVPDERPPVRNYSMGPVHSVDIRVPWWLPIKFFTSRISLAPELNELIYRENMRRAGYQDWDTVKLRPEQVEKGMQTQIKVLPGGE